MRSVSVTIHVCFRYDEKTAAKVRNKAEIEKHFWMISAVLPINKGNSRKFEESPQGATKQIEADCGMN